VEPFARGVSATLIIAANSTNVLVELEAICGCSVTAAIKPKLPATNKSKRLLPMDLIDCIRLGLLLFNGIGLVILAMHPTQEDVEDYENWIDYHDKEVREGRDRGSLS
jgi:hypothetical protein